ncbi:hypothetical protein MJO28_011544 [Puccinia striiformis f. sp. tritici]|uniref:Uncharacterized protein n=1 Tax=Puccinia striiformis f. sp. tritici TaxID=168172 RepID=A0ACC0E3T4_9BASI|nr:hypothetical protein MJO28_011544 [Puccinia striiformis f. sp. tritici]
MAQPKMKKAPPPPCTSSPTDPPVESPLPVSDIEVPESQSDIITGTPSVSQAPAENQLVKQLPTLQTTQINPQKNASRRATSGTISSRRAQVEKQPGNVVAARSQDDQWNHLDQCADYLSSKRQTLLSVNKSSQRSTSMTWVFSQKASRELLTWMIIVHKHPFTLIEQPLFRAFVASSQPKFKLLSCGTLKTGRLPLLTRNHMDPPASEEEAAQRRRRERRRRIAHRRNLGEQAAKRLREQDDVIITMYALGLQGAAGLRQLRTYLTRADLTSSRNSAWTAMKSARSDRAYVTTMGIDVATFDNLLDRFEPLWNTITLPRNDVNPNGHPKCARRSLDAAGCLGLFSGTTPARIVWPNSEAQIRPFAQTIGKKFPLLENCFGFLDGLNLPVFVAEDDDSIMAFAPDGTIMYAILNAPGSWHDSAIARPLYDRLLNHTPPGYRIISDTVFPRKSESLQSRILAPVKRGDRLPETPQTFSRMKFLNEQLVSARQAAEWGMRALQGSFARLKLPMPAADHEQRLCILQTVCHLHQLRCCMVHINQTATVYDLVWDENHILCRRFHRLLFKDIEKQCHISRYYHGWM